MKKKEIPEYFSIRKNNYWFKICNTLFNLKEKHSFYISLL